MRRRLQAVFFSPVDARDLGLFRLLYCGFLALTLLSDANHRATWRLLLAAPESFQPIRLFELLGLGAMAPHHFSLLRAGLVTSLGLAAAGVATRLSLGTASAAFFLYYGTIFSMVKPPLTDKVGHATDSVIFVLWILMLSPGVGRWGLEAWRRGRGRLGDVPSWPLRGAALMLALPYLGAFWCKMHQSVLWGDGIALQGYLIEHAMITGNDWAFWLAGRRPLCAAMSVATLLFEATFIVAVFSPRWARLYVPAGVAMHLGMYLFMDKNYFRYFALPYWSFLPWSSLSALARIAPRGARGTESRTRPPAAPRPYAASPWAAVFLAALALSHLAFIARFDEAWPFSRWRFYCFRRHYSEIVGYRVQGRRPGGSRRWLERRELRPSEPLSNNFALEQMRKAGDPDWARRQLEQLIERLPKASRLELDSIALVRRSVRLGADGRFEFVDSVEIEVGTR